jgi:hypothetical protein
MLSPSSAFAQPLNNHIPQKPEQLTLETVDPAVGSAPKTQNPPIQVTVKKVQLSLEELRDIGLDLKHVLSACRHLYDEVTIQPVSMITEPEIIDMGVVISIPVATEPAGPPAQPRKERVDLLMSEIVPVITMLKKNADDFVSGNRQLDLPDDVRQELKPDFDQWISLVNDIALRLQKLVLLTQGPPYDNDAIASAATTIQQDAKQLEDTRRIIYKIMHKEEKRAESSK